MDSLDKIKVEIISDHQSLQLYDDPEISERDTNFTRWNYVEAVTDAQFKVKVTLSKHFDLSFCEAVWIATAFDASNVYRGREIKWSRLMEKFSGGNDYVVEFDGLTSFCEHSNQWKRGSLAFGALEIKDTIDETVSLTEAKQIGRISVRVQRVLFKDHRIIPMKKISYGLISEVPEKVLKGHAIANAVKLVNETSHQVRGPSKSRTYPMHGELGNPLGCNILYRSRQALQMIGCIPRSPSPKVIPRSPSSISNLKSKIEELQAQVATLKQEKQVKHESSSSNLGVKRELEVPIKTENTPKRARVSGYIETIDLTGFLASPQIQILPL